METTATVRQVLQSKGNAVWSVDPDATVYSALELMAEKSIGAVLVMQEGRLVGILSERDYARKVILVGRASATTPVRDIMSERVVCVRPDQTVEECMALMAARHFRHLPVLEGDQVIGVISMGDVVRAIISEQAFVIQQLETYITGGVAR
jgi:CBS domain-containing protein